MKNKRSFTKRIQFSGILFLAGICIIIIATDIIVSYRNFNIRSAKLRSSHVNNQKEIIREEVNRAVSMITHERSRSTELTKTKIKARTYEAIAIAEHLYKKYRTTKSRQDIQRMILDALEPIKFEQKTGYYFVAQLNGVALLNPTTPDLIGKNLLTGTDSLSHYTLKNMINIAKKSGEGFYEYEWPRPNEKRKKFKKIAFIKYFKPLNWFIGTGLYVEDIEEQIRAKTLLRISKIRFGKEGYIFVNRLNGDALVSNGELVTGQKKLWEVFDKNPEKTKSLFKQEYDAALKPDGDFIYYSLRKLSNPEKESPKASFIRGLPELNWLVGAGVYLDDVEARVEIMQHNLDRQLKLKIIYFSLIVIGVLSFFLYFFNRLNRRLKNDTSLFISFFNRAADSSEPINRDLVHFTELDLMAKNANKMLVDKNQARQDLLDERERLYVTIQSIGDAVITTDMSGKVDLMNKIAEKLTGWDTVAANGKPLKEIFKIVNAKTREITENPVDAVINKGETVSLADHTILISKDKNEYQIADSAAPIKDTNGETIGVVLVFRDVTIEYQMREELWQSEANLRTVFEAAKNIAFVKTECFGEEIKILEFSAGAERIFGYKAEEVLGKPAAILHLKKDVAKYPKIFEKMSRDKSEISKESTLVRKSGDTFPALFTIHPVFNKRGEMTASIEVSIDISQRKRAEEELRKMEKLKSVGTLAGGIAHDFNNILMGIFGNLSLAKEQLERDHKSFKFLNDAEKSMNRSIRLTNQLLTFAKGGAPVKENISLNDLIQEIIDFDLSGSTVKPVIQCAKNLWTAHADKGQIQQVFSNLTINAKQAMPNGGSLFISLENQIVSHNTIPGLEAGKFIRITVRDKGTGIDSKIIDRIFDPYFSTKQSGNGLGLATVYSIITKHQGHISVESQLSQGTTFTLYLPASDTAVTEEKSASTKLELLKKHAKVLIMDDEEVICSLVKRMLGKSGASVDFATDGEQAVGMYKQALNNGESYDILIMDLTIPGGMGGKEAIKLILDIDPEAKAIVSSGYAEDPVIANFEKYGFKGTAAKPYTQKQLIEIINKVLTENPGKSIS